MNDLGILGLCSPSAIANLPSWSVDFTSWSGSHPLGSSRLISGVKKLYCAGGDIPPSFRFEHGTTLVIRGIPLGVLSFISATKARDIFFGLDLNDPPTYEDAEKLVNGEGLDGPADFRAIQREWLEKWIIHEEQIGAVESDLKKYFWTQEDICEVFLRTLCADIKNEGIAQVRLDEN
jgi:hypothetical protein